MEIKEGRCLKQRVNIKSSFSCYKRSGKHIKLHCHWQVHGNGCEEGIQLMEGPARTEPQLRICRLKCCADISSIKRSECYLSP